MPFREQLYNHNISILKLYGCGDNLSLKLITFKYLRTSGLDVPKENKKARGTANAEKLEQSISRSRAKIFELASCNPWEYFFTGTLDPAKYDRADLKRFSKKLRQFISNQQKKLKTKIDYILIPELHTDGRSWHIHGLLRGLPSSELHKFKVGDTMGKYIAKKVCDGDSVFSWTAYANKNPEAACKYITKYITKELSTCVKELNAHLYYHSKGLNTSTVLKKGTFTLEIPEPDYCNEYVAVSTYKYSDILLNTLLEGFADPDSPCISKRTCRDSGLFRLPHEWLKKSIDTQFGKILPDFSFRIHDFLVKNNFDCLVDFDEFDLNGCLAF